MACCRIFLSYRAKIPFHRSLNCYIWRNYTSSSNKNSVSQEDNNNNNNKVDKKQTEGYLDKKNQVFDIKRSPYVDLRASSGITVKHIRKETENSALLRHCLEESPNKDGFIKAVDIYLSKNKIRRGHIDFISTAMKFIEPYKLDKEIEVYDKLMDVFPRDKFVNRTLFDAVWPKMHPQMYLALDMLTKMEWQGLVPTEEMHDMVYEIFGRASLPLKKIYRMWFWFEEFKDINPYKLSDEVYEDRINVIKAAIDRILGNNDGTKILEISPPIEEQGMINYDHFIIGSQTLLQKKYVKFCSAGNSIYIEGPTHIWINHRMEEYFIMKTGQGELISTTEITIDPDEEREGFIIGVCFATKPYNETLQRWLQYMQDENSVLKDLNVVFNVTGDDQNSENPHLILPS